ncbi:MAG: hypothetical protein IPL22_23080 [Bacteroidetes bacterium]|nr:hypothetical protein [Bacteroidota bacterium]
MIPLKDVGSPTQLFETDITGTGNSNTETESVIEPEHPCKEVTVSVTA